ncbi:hypothetical protein U1Q18_040895 [Sarracenia purpurea var. burkii]
MKEKFTTQMKLFLTDALSLIIEDEPQSTIAMDLVISQKEGKVEDLKSGSDPIYEGGSSFNELEIETKQELRPKGDDYLTDVKIKIRRAVPEAPKSEPEESSIEDEDKAEGEDGGSSDVSTESIFSGDFENAEDLEMVFAGIEKGIAKEISQGSLNRGLLTDRGSPNRNVQFGA